MPRIRKTEGEVPCPRCILGEAFRRSWTDLLDAIAYGNLASVDADRLYNALGGQPVPADFADQITAHKDFFADRFAEHATHLEPDPCCPACGGCGEVHIEVTEIRIGNPRLN